MNTNWLEVVDLYNSTVAGGVGEQWSNIYQLPLLRFRLFMSNIERCPLNFKSDSSKNKLERTTALNVIWC